jgi:hypothetical protein
MEVKKKKNKTRWMRRVASYSGWVKEKEKENGGNDR